jgi:hypothetical protein
MLYRSRPAVASAALRHALGNIGGSRSWPNDENVQNVIRERIGGR